MNDVTFSASDYYILGLAFTDRFQPDYGDDEDDDDPEAISPAPSKTEFPYSDAEFVEARDLFLTVGIIESRGDSTKLELTRYGELFCWAHRLQIYEALIDGAPIEDLQRFRAAYSEYENEVFGDTGESLNADLSFDIPAADRVVTIQDNQRLPSLTSKVEAAQEAVQKSNSLSASTDGWISEHLKLGIALLRQPKVLLAAVAALILKPLYTAYQAVAEDAAKGAIQEAIAAVQAFFGI